MDATSQNLPVTPKEHSEEESLSSTSSGFNSQPPSKKSYTKLILFAIVILVAGILVGLYFLTQQSRTNMVSAPTVSPSAPVQKLVIGTDATLPPMEYIDEGKFIGYDIDLANALAQELNTEVEIKNIEFDNLFTALEQKEIDMIISAVTITEERKLKLLLQKKIIRQLKLQQT